MVIDCSTTAEEEISNINNLKKIYFNFYKPNFALYVLFFNE